MPTAEDLQQDKEFMSATPADQTSYLSSTDPDFKAAHPEDQAAYLAHVTKAAVPATPKVAPVQEKPKGMLETAEDYWGKKAEPVDKAVTGALAPNNGPGDDMISPVTESAKSLGRSVYSMGKTIAGMPMGIYHGLTDPATEEEKATHAQFERAHGEAPGAETSGMKRIGLAAGRMSGLLSGEEAINTYANPATRPTYEQALSVAPEALGQGAGTVVGAEMGGKATKGITRENLPTTVAARDAAVRGIGRAAGTVLKNPELAGTIAGAVTGHGIGSIYLGSKVGRILAKAGIGPEIVDPLRYQGLEQEAINLDKRTQDLEKATKEADKTRAALNTYQATIDEGGTPPEAVQNAHTKAHEAQVEAQKHYDAAERAVLAKSQGPTPELTLTPEQQAAQDARTAKPPTPAPPAPTPQNVKVPGQVQPETFPQVPTEAPRMATGRQELAGGQGTMGRNRMLTEGTPEGPAPAPAVAEAPVETPTRERMVAPKPGRMGSLKVDETGKVVDKETPLQQRIEEGLQGTAKPVAVAPKTTNIPEAPLIAPEDLGLKGTDVRGRIYEPEAPKAEPKAEAPKETSPEDMTKTEQVVSQHTDQELMRLGRKYGLDDSKYDFAKRDENRHRVERDDFVNELLSKMPPEDVSNIARLSDEFNKKDSTLWSEAERNALSKAQRSRAIMQEHEGGPKKVAGGAPEEAEEKPRSTSFSQQRAQDEAAYKQADKLYPKVGTSEEAKAEEKAGPKGFPDYQDVADYHNENKGFTYNMEKGFMKDQPGFSVAGDFPGTEKVFPSHNLQAKDIQAYVERPDVKAALEADPKNSVGGWMYKGKSHLEVSKLYNDMGDALDAAKKNNQTSIFDHEHKQEIPTGGTAAEEAQAKAEGEPKNVPNPKMTEAQQDAAAAKGEGGGSGASKKLPTGDELIKKYGESNGDPAQTAFILADGRGVAQTGTIHDEMLGGKATNKESPREAFIDQGNIRIRARSGGVNGRETSISIPESGITPKQLEYLKKMSPQLQSGRVVVEVGKVGGAYRMLDDRAATPEVLEKTLRELAPVTPEGYPKGTPEVGGGSGAAATATTKETTVAKATAKAEKMANELPPLEGLAAEHLTPEEKLGVSKTGETRDKFVKRMESMPEVHEWVDAAQRGAAERKWYQRSNQAIKAMAAEAPEYFDQPGDQEKFTGLMAGGSPQQSVVMNLREALKVWTKYVDEGRPTGKALESLLRQSPAKGGFTMAGSKVPNVLKALAGEPMWPDITKNSNFKVPSFRDNLLGFLNRVTNDGWMGAFAGMKGEELSGPDSYHPISVMTREAAKQLGWEPAEAQAAIWAFIKTLTEKGAGAAEDPYEMRRYSEDYADIIKHDPDTRNILKDMGLDHAKLAERFEREVEGKPKPREVTGTASATAEDSTGRAIKRVEKLRGKGAVPSSKTGQLHFDEEPDENTEFNPDEFKSESRMIPKKQRMKARGAQ